MDKHVGHFRRYNRKSLIRLLENAGYKISYCKYFDSLGYLASLLYKWSGGRGVINEKSISFYDKYCFPISRILDVCGLQYLVGKNLIVEAKKI